MDDVTALRDALVAALPSRYFHREDMDNLDVLAALDALIAAAEARAALTPERQEVMVEMLADVWCFATGGGTEGKWCINHDVPMADDGADCLTVARWRRVILAALPRPEEPRVERCAFVWKSDSCGKPERHFRHKHDSSCSSGEGHITDMICHPFTSEAR